MAFSCYNLSSTTCAHPLPVYQFQGISMELINRNRLWLSNHILCLLRFSRLFWSRYLFLLFAYKCCLCGGPSPPPSMVIFFEILRRGLYAGFRFNTQTHSNFFILKFLNWLCIETKTLRITPLKISV